RSSRPKRKRITAAHSLTDDSALAEFIGGPFDAGHAGPSMVRTVLSAPGVARVFLASMVGRIPAGALGLLLILRVRELGGGYADGGLVAGALSLGMGAAAPLVGRVVDTRGQTRVLAASATVCA